MLLTSWRPGAAGRARAACAPGGRRAAAAARSREAHAREPAARGLGGGAARAGVHDLRRGGPGALRPGPGIRQSCTSSIRRPGSSARTGRPCSDGLDPGGAGGLQPVRADESMTASGGDAAGDGGERRNVLVRRGSTAGLVAATVPVEVILSHFFHRGTPYVIAVARDIGDRLQQQVLETAREDRRRPTPPRNRFLANIGHEIRTPLAAIVIDFDLMGRRTMDPDERVERTRRVQQHAAHLTALIDGVLDLSRIEAARHAGHGGARGAGPARARRRRALSSRVHAPRGRARWSVAPAVPALFVTDGLRLRQVLSNLVGNAVALARASRSRSTLEGEVPRLRRGGHRARHRGGPPRAHPRSVPAGQQPNLHGLGPRASPSRTPCARRSGASTWPVRSGDELPRVGFHLPPLEHEPRQPDHRGRARCDADLTGRLGSQHPRGRRQSRPPGAGALLARGGRGHDPGRGRRAGGRAPGALFAFAVRSARLRRHGAGHADARPRWTGGPGRGAGARGYRGPVLALTAHALVQDRERCLALGFDAHLGSPCSRSCSSTPWPTL